MPQLVYQVNKDGKSWGGQYNTPPSESSYGLQMANFRGELYAIMTGTDKQLYATKYKPCGAGWKAFRALSEKYKSEGRVAVTALGDRFYVCYRGTNDKVYMLYTEDFDKWVDAGEVGSNTSTKVAPAIQAYGDKIHVIHASSTIYAGTCDRNGKLVSAWAKLAYTGTGNALAMTVFRSKLYQFHNGGNKDVYYFVLNDNGTWSTQLSKVPSSPIISGVSAVTFKDNRLHITYKTPSNDLAHRSWDGQTWTDAKTISCISMVGSQTGLGTYLGYLFLSYSNPSTIPPPMGYSAPLGMNEKLPFDDEETDEELSVAWAQPRQKSMVRKLFCL